MKLTSQLPGIQQAGAPKTLT